MSGFPGLEAKILKTLEEEGEMRPPAGRIGQEYFWQAAARLQARGLCVADQAAGVVRPAPKIEPRDEWAVRGGKVSALLSQPRPVTDLRARCALLIQRWRQAGGERGRCAIDLEEVLEETL